MSSQFCTSCGHSVKMYAKFCENCGAVLGNAGSTVLEKLTDAAPAEPTSATETGEAVVKHARLVVSAWIIPFNATLVFGSTMVAVFDFLSPRFALLPIAAAVAVTGMLAALALRKFVAPSLPQGSTLRRALSPELGVHKSPIVITTGLLSALMVSGAAWSHVNAPGGGVIASKFDAAKNAQVQLGILQAIQKEQRGQTAVLEDIRDGRTLNPRRELANQGILWTYKAFEDALEAKDLTVVTLFISGGMTWGPYAGLKALWSKQDAISDQLISRPELLDLDAMRLSQYGCFNYIQVFNQPSRETEKLQDSKQIRPRVLRAQDKQWLKLICGNEEGKATALAELQDQMAKHSALPAAECRKRLTHNDASAIAYLTYDSSGMYPIPFERDRSETATLRRVMLEQSNKASSDTLRPMSPANNRDFSTPNPNSNPNRSRSDEASRNRLMPQVLEAINDYCSMVSRRPPAEYNGWTVESMKQIVAALN